MAAFDAKMLVLVTLSAIFLPKEAHSQWIGGRWRSGFGSGVAVTLPEPLCPPGEYWVASWGTCIPHVRGPGGRWRSGRRRSGGRWRTGNLLPVPRPFAFGLEPSCALGDIWVESLQSCVPWLRGPGGRWRSNPVGRWRSNPVGRWRSGSSLSSRGRVCPPGYIWNQGFTECIPYNPTARGRVCPPGQIWNNGFTECIPYIPPTSSGLRFRSGNSLSSRGRVCPPGYIWNQGFTECIPYMPPALLAADDLRGRVCPPGYIWNQGFTECIPYNPTALLVADDDMCHRCWG